MDITQKTPGELIDEISKINIKIFFLIEKETNPNLPEHERFLAGQSVLQLNSKRNKLIRGLDNLLGYGENSVDVKTY